MTHKNIHVVFPHAVVRGILSLDCNASNFWAHYMYMGTDDEGTDLFKHKHTRDYVRVTRVNIGDGSI
jgi:hypothetical protein